MVDIEAAARFQRERATRIAAARRRGWETAHADAQRIVEMIVGRYSPEAVYQWGSVLRPDRFTELSDIDIAVKGALDARQFSALLGDAETMTDFPIDIVQLERIEPEFRDLIVTCGRCMHERED